MKKIFISILIFTSFAAAADNKKMLNLSAAFTPLSLSTLRAWGDCSDATKVSQVAGVISAVTDKSTNAYSWGLGVAPTWVNSVQNGLSTCRFSSGKYLTGSTGSDITAGTVCILVNPSSLAQFNALWSSSTVPSASMILEVGASANKLDIWKSGTGATAATGGGSIATSTWYRICVASDNSTPLATIYINNVSASTSSSASLKFTMGNFNISKDNAANFTAWVGDIGEWIITTSVSTADIGNIDTYWKNKWGL